MSRSWRQMGTMVVLSGLSALACSSDNNTGSGAGGSAAGGGAGHASGGATGRGGSAGGAGGVTGQGGAGGSAGAGGSSTITGKGGSSGNGAGGSGGGGGASSAVSDASIDGAIDAACTGVPPLTEHNVCMDIASLKKGDAGFAITSTDFSFCGPVPAAMTCDGHGFGTGTSPSLSWSGAPAETLSYALVFKDISILADGDPTTERLGYHWVMWDIPPTVKGLPTGTVGGYHSTDVSGALQWSGRNNYGFFPPCPNPFPQGDARFTCSLVDDSYSFTLYALPVAKLDNLPAPDLDATTGLPTGNYVVKMGHYLDSLSALAVTEYRGTSHAWAASFSAPAPVEYPCTAGAGLDGGIAILPALDGGAAMDSSIAMDAGASAVCLQ